MSNEATDRIRTLKAAIAEIEALPADWTKRAARDARLADLRTELGTLTRDPQAATLTW